MNFAHNMFVKASSISASRHMSTYAMFGGIGNAAISYMNGESMIQGGFEGAVLGAGLGAGLKQLGNMYTKGAMNLINETTNASGGIYSGTTRNINNKSQFNINNFTRPDNLDVDLSWWHGNSEAIANTRWQHYAGNMKPAEGFDINTATVGSAWVKNAAHGNEIYQ